jgi:Flp pilus assembly protein TadD
MGARGAAPWRHGLLACLLIVGAGLAAYWNSFDGPFIFDDPESISGNPTIRQLWPIGPALSPPGRGVTVQGRPVVNLSLAVNWAVGQDSVRGYHVLNLAIHLVAGLLLFGVVRRTLLLPRLAGRLGRGATGIALAAALVWTVHPLQTESVTYVVQRAESIMGLFYLLTLYCVIRGAGPGGAATAAAAKAGSSRPAAWFIFATAACLCGMASKEVMVTAPLVVLLYDRTFLAGSFKGALRRRWPLYLALAATWGLLAYLVGSADRGGSAGFGLAVTPWRYALTQLGVVMHYLGLALWPRRLVIDYGWPIASTVGQVLPGAIVIGLLLAGTAWALVRRPSAGFLCACFFLMLSPSSSFVPVVTEVAAEHRMYLPLAAVVVLAVATLYRAWQWSLEKAAPQGRPAGAMRALPLAAAAIVVVALGYGTLERNEDYKTELAIWRDTVAKRPDNARANYDLGLALAAEGSVRDAIWYYEQALRVKPDYPEALNNLGVALVDTGSVPDAIARYELALKLKPDYALAENDLGVALAREDKVPQAVGHFERALQLKPDYAEAQNNLGLALAGTGRAQEAIGHYERALQLKPDYPAAHNNLGCALANAGRAPEAIAHFERAIELEPDNAQARANLAKVRGSRGQP